MDETDLAVYREMARGRVFFWASLDPRVSAETIARRLKLSPTTVRSRVRAWERAGALAGREVLPHPSLLGLRLGAGSIRIDDPRAKPRVLEALALVPGALAVLDHVGPWLAFTVLAPSEAATERVRRLVARLPGVDEVTPCRSLDPPAPSRDALSSLDWRVLQALRADPTRALGEAARAVGVSAKTFSKRYERLLAENAALFVPLWDLSRIEGVVARLILVPEEGADRRTLLARMRRFPRVMDAFDAEVLVRAGHPPLDLWVHARNAGEAEALQRAALDLPGVAHVELALPVRNAFFTGWLDEAIATRMAEAGPRS